MVNFLLLRQLKSLFSTRKMKGLKFIDRSRWKFQKTFRANSFRKWYPSSDTPLFNNPMLGVIGASTRSSKLPSLISILRHKFGRNCKKLSKGNFWPIPPHLSKIASCCSLKIWVSITWIASFFVKARNKFCSFTWPWQGKWLVSCEEGQDRRQSNSLNNTKGI